MKMDKNTKILTVLEKCQVTLDIIKFLKRKGLTVPKKIRPVKKPLRSPSEEWFYSIADRFTPPLNPIEKQVFLTSPHLLTLQILKAVDLLSEVSTILYDALEKVKTNLKTDEEKAAAILAILKIFHGCLDYNYLKYDRHLEYHEYKESPVGFYWKKLKKFVLRAAKNAKISNPEDWANKKLLEIISGPRRLLITSEYSICCKSVYNQLKNLQINFNSPTKIILDKIKKYDLKLFKLIKKYSECFYCSPEKLVNDAIALKNKNPHKSLMKSKEISFKAIKEVKSKLSKKEAYEFERTIEIIEDFIACQELEGLIAYGIRPNVKNSLFDILIEAYNQLYDLLNKNINLVRPKYKKIIQNLFKSKDIDVPSKFIALRKLISEMEYAFVKEVEEFYKKEFKRWNTKII